MKVAAIIARQGYDRGGRGEFPARRANRRHCGSHPHPSFPSNRHKSRTVHWPHFGLRAVQV